MNRRTRMPGSPDSRADRGPSTVASAAQNRQETRGPRIDRRTALLAGLGALAAVGGGAAWATNGPTITYPEGTYGSTGPRVLVAYDSQYGSTGDIATAIGQVLAADARVDVRHISNVTSFQPYSATVLGAPVQTDRWRRSALEFLGDHSSEVAGMPFALFLASMSYGLDPDPQRQDAQKAPLLAEAAARVPGADPVSTKAFGGFVDFARMTPANAAVYRLVAGDPRPGDYRDFPGIRRWAASIAPALLR
ncbi:MAG: flavodoxin domain-containing protein [Dermatophilus congolensis]|nr:flavodoxin domain-containing protein [Dermatophilus congolensis]